MSMPMDDEGGGVVDGGSAGVFPCGCFLVMVGGGYSLHRCGQHGAAADLCRFLDALGAAATLAERNRLTEENTALKAALGRASHELDIMARVASVAAKWRDEIDALLPKEDRCPS